jgi:hypothetical protein
MMSAVTAAFFESGRQKSILPASIAKNDTKERSRNAAPCRKVAQVE